MHLRIGTESVADDHEKKVGNGDDQSHGEADGGLPAVGGDAERHTDHAAGSFAARLAALSQAVQTATATRSDPERGFDASTSPLARRLAGGHAAWKSR